RDAYVPGPEGPRVDLAAPQALYGPGGALGDDRVVGREQVQERGLAALELDSLSAEDEVALGQAVVAIERDHVADRAGGHGHGVVQPALLGFEARAGLGVLVLAV